jgi:hypothetical protein
MIGKSGGSSVAHACGVCAAVLVDVKLLLHVVLVSRSVVSGKK